MCCVMPPASRSATLVSRIASSSEVLPWSTWPMTVTTGARLVRSSGWLSSCSTSSSSASKLRSSTSAPKSRAIDFAVSTSSVVFNVIMMRRSSSFFRTSFVLTSSLSARSLTVMPSEKLIVRDTGGGAAGAEDIAVGRGASRRSDVRRPPDGRPPGRGGCHGGRGPLGGTGLAPGTPGRGAPVGAWYPVPAGLPTTPVAGRAAGAAGLAIGRGGGGT